ncbi:MAG: hypothetical protein KIT34_03720 [Cyanobacteria bacterium TGS_CYA1]|nr:hypothetical protein [Cyanobacteria bacterium TGS_CYA1]
MQNLNQKSACRILGAVGVLFCSFNPLFASPFENNETNKDYSECLKLEQQSREQIGNVVKEKFELLLTTYPKVKSELGEFEIVFCVNRDFKITHVFWLGLNGIARELLSEVLTSLEGNEILMLPDFYFSSEKEIDVRFHYPPNNEMLVSKTRKTKSFSHWNDERYSQAINLYKINFFVRKKLQEYLKEKKLSIEKVKPLKISFLKEETGEFKVVRFSPDNEISQKVKSIIEEMPLDLVKVKTSSRHGYQNHFWFSYPRADYITELNYNTHSFDRWSLPEDIHGSSTSDYKQYLKRKPKH